MSRDHRSAVRAHAVGARCVLLLATAAAGCTSWHPQPVTPETIERARDRGPIRVTPSDGTVFELFTFALVRDTLVGTTDPAGLEPVRRVAMPLATVQGIAVRRFDSLRTVGLVAASLLIIGGLATGGGSFGLGNVGF